MPRRQQCPLSADSKIPLVPYDFSAVPNCIATKESGLQASVLEEIVNRAEWTASVAELVGLSHEAADRRARKTGSFRGIHHNNAEAERLSFSFITERTQTDDPIEGYMVRTKDRSRHLQGFLWFTNFTTWTHFFRWDSLASKAELHGRAQRDGISWDSDGLLSSELELQHREGDPNDQGVIWPRVAEIALVGGLECGGFLVQLALEALEQSMAYDFVVVQATESSAGFYDRMGFRRVGALAKYITSDVAPHQARTVAYRHWAYPDEDVSKMDSSIMMAVKLRAGQVVKRVMAQEGGIFPNRHRFMEKIPSRGVLSARPRLGTNSTTQLSRCDRIPSVDAGCVALASAEFLELSPSHESSKDVARRSQTCRAWVCYGNPSATILSPKRRRDGASNQLHRSGAPITMQADAGTVLVHSAESRGQVHQSIGSGEVRPCPRAPRGMFRPSKRKSCGGDPCITVDLEPTGTAPESDLFPAGVTIPPLTQRPRRDRSSLSLERRYADYVTGSLPSPARAVAVAVRSYPPAEVSVHDSAGIGAQSLPSVAPSALIAQSCSDLSMEKRAESFNDNSGSENPEPSAELNAVEGFGSIAEINCVVGAETAISLTVPKFVEPVVSPRPVAIRRYPPPVRRVDLRPAGDVVRLDDTRPSARKAVLSSVTRRLRRTKPYLTLRARYAARARAAKERAAALEFVTTKSSLVEKLELGPLQLSTRPKLERVVPDLLSAAGVVSTKGPFDCDDETSLPALPALPVPVKTRSDSGTDAMALPTLEGVDFFERCTCFELMIAGEDRPCCEFCTRRKDEVEGDDTSKDDKNATIIEEENDERDAEDTQTVQSKAEESDDSRDEEAGLARDRQPRRRIPVSKFRFHQLNLRIYPRKGGSHSAKLPDRSDQIARAKQSAARSQTRSWRERNPTLAKVTDREEASTAEHQVAGGSPPTAAKCDTSEESSVKTAAHNDSASEDDDAADAEMDSEDSPFVANLSFPPYPWATEDDGEAIAGQVWRPMTCPFTLIDGIVHAWKGYEAVAPVQGKRSLVVSCCGNSKVSGSVEEERLEDGSDAEEAGEDVKCDGCSLADREDEMILCDRCDSGWHLDCLKPALSAVPEGEWLCPNCSKQTSQRSVSQVKSFTVSCTEESLNSVRSKPILDCSGTPPSKQVHSCDTESIRLMPSRHRQPVVRFKFHRTIQDNSISFSQSPPLKNVDSPAVSSDQSPSTSTSAVKVPCPSDLTGREKLALTPTTKSAANSCRTPSAKFSASKSPAVQSPAAAGAKGSQSQSSSPSTVPKATSCKSMPPTSLECSSITKKSPGFVGSSKPAPISAHETSAIECLKRVSSSMTKKVSSAVSKPSPVSLPTVKGALDPDDIQKYPALKSSSSHAARAKDLPVNQSVIFSSQSKLSAPTARLSHHKKPVNTGIPRSHMKLSSPELSSRNSNAALPIHRNVSKHGTNVKGPGAIPVDSRLSSAGQRSSSDSSKVAGAGQLLLSEVATSVQCSKAGHKCQPLASMPKIVGPEADSGFWNKVRSDSLRRICEDMGVPVTGNREALIARIMARLGLRKDGKASKWLDELLSVRMSSLRRVCGDLSISMGGNKETLIRRLISHNADDNQVIAQVNVGGGCGAPDFSSVWQEWPCDGCGRADREDEMVLCDACDAGWHLDCLSPALQAVPAGDWLCPECAVANRVKATAVPSEGHRAGASQGQKSASTDGSRKRVRYAMLRTSSGRDLDRFDHKSARTCRAAVPVKRQRVQVARFRFSSIDASAAQQ